MSICTPNLVLESDSYTCLCACVCVCESICVCVFALISEAKGNQRSRQTNQQQRNTPTTEVCVSGGMSAYAKAVPPVTIDTGGGGL